MTLKPRAALYAVVLLVAMVHGVRAATDECEPAKPDDELAAARQAGRTILTGEQARRFVAGLKGQHVPIASADYVFLSLAAGIATMTWIDDAKSPIAARCDWEAAQGTPLAAIIARAIAQSR